MTTTFSKIYPGARLMGINEMLVEGCPKWFGTLVTDPKDILAIAKRGHDGAGRKIRMMNIRFMTEEGRVAFADFTPFELV